MSISFGNVFSYISGAQLHRLEGHLGIVRCMYIDKDKLISGGDQKKIIIWNYKVSK